VTAKKRGLGRGLDALIEKGPEPGVRKLPLASLKPNRLQPRASFAEETLAELAESIRSQGLVQPLLVKPEADGTYSIIAGERRFRAAALAGLSEVPVVVRDVASDRELLELALVENLQRTDLNPVEEAEAFLTLQERFGLSQEEIAGRVGKSRPAVANALRLLRLPEEVLELLRAGSLTAGQARPLLALGTAQEQSELARRTVREGLSARDLERIAARPKDGSGPPATPGSAKPVRPVDVHTAAAAETLTRRFQTRVDIYRGGRGGSGGKGGQVRIHFHTEDELMRLYDALMQRGAEP
jgi:ParB family chromosome partitioning protein